MRDFITRFYPNIVVMERGILPSLRPYCPRDHSPPAPPLSLPTEFYVHAIYDYVTQCQRCFLKL